MSLKGNYVRFRRQTHEHDREELGASTEHYIIEDPDARGFMGYVTVRHISAPDELSATVLLQETQSWGSPQARDVLQAIERYAFEMADCQSVSLEVNGGDTTALEQLAVRGFTVVPSGRRTVVRKARDATNIPG